MMFDYSAVIEDPEVEEIWINGPAEVYAARGATLGLVVAVSLFLNSSRTVVLVGHDTVVRPTMSRGVPAGATRPNQIVAS